MDIQDLPERIAESRRVRAATLPIVRAITEVVMFDELGDGATESAVDEVAERLYRKLVHMPRHLKLGMLFANHLFSSQALATYGKSYPQLPRDQRRAQLDAWRKSPIGLFVTFTDFYGKMSVFVHYSLEEEREEAQHA